MKPTLLSVHSSFHAFDSNLHHLMTMYGRQIYILLFLIIFAKTAYIIFTFLPGDATLFASGTIAAIGQLDIRILAVLFIVSTIAGDAHNFLLGHLLKRAKLKQRRFSITRLIPDRSLVKASQFLAKYGKLSIMFSRFIPLLSATVPFVSGLTGYRFRQFFIYNLAGAIIWSLLWVFAGYGLGNIDWVANHLSITLILITLATLLPAISAFVLKIIKHA